MKRVFTAVTVIEKSQMQALKAMLDDAGMAAIIRNETLAVLTGEIPPSECYPELWVIRDENHPAARRIIEEWRNTPVPVHSRWKCPVCGEESEGQFTSCWKCGTERSAREQSGE